MRIAVISLALLFAYSQAVSQELKGRTPAATARIIVYKTKGNYNNLVPVSMSEDGKKITSYPAPTDLRSGKSYRTPTKLNKGYLLDNKGINKNVAFLKLTYAQYAQKKSAPTVEELYKLIYKKGPLAEIYDCGVKGSKTTAQLNSIIKNNKLRTTCSLIK